MARVTEKRKRSGADEKDESQSSKRAKTLTVNTKKKPVVNASTTKTTTKKATTKTTEAPKTAAKKPAAKKPATKKPAAYVNDVPSRKMQFYVFGDGSAGELGLGAKNAMNVSTPRLNPNLSSIVNLAAGGMHAAAITSDKQFLTWGVNDEKALGRDTDWDGGLRDAGDGSESDSDDGELNPREATPTAVASDVLPADTELVQVAAGDSTTFVLTREGLVYGAGIFRDANGQFGFSFDPKTKQVIKNQSVFTLVSGLKNIKALSTGADFALALDNKGQVFAWGPGQQGQLGRRVLERRRREALVPARVELPKRIQIVSIHTGIDHAFAIDTDGDTWAWGLNNFAQTGVADLAGEGEAVVSTPRKVPALAGKKMLSLSGGRHHSIGVTETGECLIWGRIDSSQSGMDLATLPVDDSSKVMLDDRGRPRILLEPTAVPIPSCVYATAGPDHCIAITSEGKAYSWGFNVGYQCGQGNDDDVDIAKLMNAKAIREVKFCWAGAGGQYSMLAAYQDEAPVLTNGVHKE